ncbi:squalene synthase isoform X1 [Sarcophilus harrisii]|uniref:squalene synthase isoform X1 n=1 Tax=Sarcophilus harrisii TaxID=9305 RepID=UPI0002739741|nr:squalene synthase isoform X1 [Sarcophilus harrisii]
MAAACCTKAGAFFKLTLGLTPTAAPRASGIGVGSSQRCCVSAFSPWTSRDWCRGEGICYWPPIVSRLSQPRASSTSTSTSTSTCLLCPQDTLSDGLKTCYKYLNQTSRSFAAVIQALDNELRNAVCIFYLVLRALDTVEDDMTISMEKKVPLLQNFHSYLYQPDWRYMESNQKDRQVLEDFSTVSLEFRNLAESYQVVINDICQKMGHGMAEFLEKKVNSVQEWEKYCHYVAGLVGIGLSRLFSASELEDPIVGQDSKLANSMGLFLQKTNIIRDYLEDIMEGREFWPQEVWSRYAKKLSDLAKPENIDLAVHCLNELITNALQHIPDVLTYLSQLRNQSVFNFCAIPQVMAIATLAACYNNQQVFRGRVKIRKGQAVTLMMEATNMPAVKAIMYQYMEEIYQRIPSSDPSSSKTKQIISSVRKQNLPSCQLVSRNHYSPIYLSCAMLLVALSWQYLSTMSQATEEYVQTGEH